MERENLSDAKERLSYAESDLGVAEHLFKTYYPKPLAIIGFHCQQAAEKSVKSLIALYGNQGGMPKKHDIFLLLNQIKNMTDIDKKYYDYADILSPYGIAVRYPNELILEEHYAERAIYMAGEFVKWAKGAIEADSGLNLKS